MSRRLGPSGIFWLSVVFFRVFRGAFLVMGAGLVAFLLLLLGSRVVRKRASSISGSGGRADIGGARRADIGNHRRADIGGRDDSDALSKSYDPALVVDARYEEIE